MMGQTMEERHVGGGGVAKRMLADNPALVVGVALPLVLMALFFVAGRASVATTDPPQYDALFAVEYNERWRDGSWRIRLADGRVVVETTADEDGRAADVVEPSLYLFEHETLRAVRLDVDFSRVVDGRVEDPALETLNARRLLAGPESPDGYRFERRERSGTGGFFAEVFGFGRARSPYVLRRDDRTIPVRGEDPIYQAHFIAWVGE